MSTRKVKVIEPRAGLRKAYNVGQVIDLPPDKANIAVARKWAVFVDEKAGVAKVAPAPSPKMAAPATEAVADLITEQALEEMFGDDADALLAFADERGISTGRAKYPSSIRRAILKHYE